MLETDRKLHEDPFFERTEIPKEIQAQKKRQEGEDRRTEEAALNLVRLKLLVIIPTVEQQASTPVQNFEEKKEHPFITGIMLIFELIAAVANAVARR